MPEDLLSRKPFADMLAEAIVAAPTDTSAVFALCGGWGTGKTWTTQRIVEAVGSRATVLIFEPWMVSTPEALAREFFLDLARGALKAGNDPESIAKRERFWRYAAQVLEVTGAIASPLAILGVPGAGLVGEAAKKFRDPIKAAAEGLKTLSEKPSLRDARDNLIRELRDLTPPVLMVVDDVDRLTEEEIRTLFRLIKACADFPNVKYLLVFDRPQVVKALGDAFGSGEEFLDKIIRSMFDLPEVTSEQRAHYLDEALEKVLPKYLTGDAYDRVSLAFHGVLLPGLSTLRLVDRYVATLTDLLRTLVHQGRWEVDPADFLLIEYLRQRAPHIYAALREWDAPVAGGIVRRLAQSEDVDKERETRLTKAIESEKSPPELIDQALEQLAGKVSFSSGKDLFEAGTAEHKAMRFSSELWRPAYFGFDAERAAFSSKALGGLRQALASEAGTADWLKNLDDSEKRQRLLGALMLRVIDLTDDQCQALLTGLIRWGAPRAFDQVPGSLGFGSWPHVVGTLGQGLLVQLGRKEKAYEAFRASVAATGALLGPATIVWQEKIAREKRQWKESWTSDEQFAELQAEFARRLRECMTSEEVWEHPNPRDLYTVYHELADATEAEAWYASFWSDPKQVANWINKWLTTYVEPNGHVGLGEPSSLEMFEALRKVPNELLDLSGQAARNLYTREVIADRRRNGRFTKSLPIEAES